MHDNKITKRTVIADFLASSVFTYNLPRLTPLIHRVPEISRGIGAPNRSPGNERACGSRPRVFLIVVYGEIERQPGIFEGRFESLPPSPPPRPGPSSITLIRDGRTRRSLNQFAWLWRTRETSKRNMYTHAYMYTRERKTERKREREREGGGRF